MTTARGPEAEGKQTEVAGVLLDVDGTLLDSNGAHARAWKAALDEQGLSFELPALLRLIGMGADQFLPRLGLNEDRGAGKTAKERKKVLFRERYLPSLRPQPGARALIERMRRERIKPVVATSAGHDELSLLLRAAGIEDLIEAQATSADAERSKPDPDIVHAAIARSQMPREKLVMLGDTPYDVTASTRAGVPIVGVRCGGWCDDAMRGAAEIYDNPADLEAHFDRSYFARRSSPNVA